VRAEDIAEARDAWCRFCACVGQEDDLTTAAGQFYVHMLDQDPDIFVDEQPYEPEEDAPSPPTAKLGEGYRKNFDTLETACHRGDLALVSAVRKADNADVALVCAMSCYEDEETQELVHRPVPLAEMINGNPYEMYHDPTAVSTLEEKEEDDGS
jgi:hypothetical protein